MFQPPDPSAYNPLVWAIARQIPEGRVSTYGQIASMIPAPDGVDPDQYRRLAPRWVGNAMHGCPDDVPWQRVINSEGKISLPAGSAGADEQRARLEMEGVSFDADGRIDLDRYGWDGPDEQWLAEHGLFKPRSLRKKSSPDSSSQMNLF
jgi:methylated-DNA-protein-cysteine methyltransferase-like protein